MAEYVFSDTDRQYGKAVGVKKSDGDFRCYQCVDFSFYERNVSEQDAEERCSYCGGFVFIAPEVIAQLEAPKQVRPVNLQKRDVQRFDLLSIAYHLRTRLDEVSFAYDKARQRIAELEARLAEREDAGFVETVDA
ncbi:hypothetical protein EDD96_2293 [Streptomyces sp. Ag109_G2-6]|uniref:hypothetical protein n=1 Tax=Streptomyces sp. Ag109_G2-6 TaxID=2485154 RepID=UPI000F4F8967|nr:hypothetical protein [Streptomyces sp. Ag109_G2-6]RPF45731.1 hypothetical protein EDD96_2293 [Streptomyces sp. Ag109_G2-6]